MVTDKLVYTRSTHARQIGTGVHKVFVHLNKTSPCKEFNTSKLKATIIFKNSKHMTLYVHIYFNNSRQTLEFEFQYQLSHCSLMMRKCYPVCLNVYTMHCDCQVGFEFRINFNGVPKTTGYSSFLFCWNTCKFMRFFFFSRLNSTVL